jgi:hypothetical protein
MKVKEINCKLCGNTQKIVIPVKHDPICKQCRSPIGFKEPNQ